MKFDEKIDKSMFAPCGMNCKVCYKHLKPKKACNGCLLSDEDKPEHCRKCPIKICVKGKNLLYCFECDKFPCQLIKKLEKSYNIRYKVSLVGNSLFVKNNGIEVFMIKEIKRWSCQKCQGIVSLHDKLCSECDTHN